MCFCQSARVLISVTVDMMMWLLLGSKKEAMEQVDGRDSDGWKAVTERVGSAWRYPRGALKKHPAYGVIGETPPRRVSVFVSNFCQLVITTSQVQTEARASIDV